MQRATATACRTSCSRPCRAGGPSSPATSARCPAPSSTGARACSWRRPTPRRWPAPSSSSPTSPTCASASAARRARASRPTSSSTAAPRDSARSWRRSMPSSVAYVLKGWPRISELFIASEIYRREQAGLPLRLYVIKPPDEAQTHPVVDRIQAPSEYLPPTTSLSGTTLLAWLRENLGRFLPALRRTARRHPRGLARATGAALAQCVRVRSKRFGWPRNLYVKELLQAVALADRLADAPDVRHLHAPFAHGATTVTWLCSQITGLPFSFTGHAKDIYSPKLNPAGLLRRKLLAARFAVTCTEANVRHLKTIAPKAVVQRVYHGLNADFSRLMGEERAAAAPGPNGTNGARRDVVRLLGVGRRVEKKGFDVVVDAGGELDRRGVPFEAVIVGPDDDAGPQLPARIPALGLGGRRRARGAHPARGADEPGPALRGVSAGVGVLSSVPHPRQRRPRRHPERARRGD